MIGFLELACSIRRRLDGNGEIVRRRTSTNDVAKIVSKDLKRQAGGAKLADEEFISLESVMAEFRLSNNTLKRMMHHMSDDMDRGLEGGLSKSTIAMLPSFVPEMPDGSERGKFVAMDLGGTNLRVMIMEIEPGEEMRCKQFNTRMPNWAQHGTGQQLFDFIAKALADFLIEKGVDQDGLPVGFTFSYPCDQTSLRSATLLRWTKGVTATGCVGRDVVQMLEEAIKRDGRINVEIMALINDTVGTMVAAAYQNKGQQCDVGVIIGTGTNASYMEHTKNIHYGVAKATEPYPYKQMIIDTEWGGFGDRGEADYIFTEYDRIIDRRSDHPGVNSLDKLIAGMCMGELVRLVLEKLTRHKVLFDGMGSETLFTIGTFPTKYISEILHDDCGSYQHTRQIMGELGIDDYTFSDMLLFREVCVVVSRRAANLAAASIACVLNRVKRPKMIIGIDGSTYKYHPFFEHWVNEKIRELVDPGLDFKIVQTGDGSGRGAALITAIIWRLKKRKQIEEQNALNRRLSIENEEREKKERKSEEKEAIGEEREENRWFDDKVDVIAAIGQAVVDDPVIVAAHEVEEVQGNEEREVENVNGSREESKEKEEEEEENSSPNRKAKLDPEPLIQQIPYPKTLKNENGVHNRSNNSTSASSLSESDHENDGSAINIE
ncbi:unnamed protein product, partial [Mesorhabditis belari]|uniref:hexokinase n=1 Tax=Mesorhabditis belari TaxID=2138241 RepID=A0AAF3J794_9BILA